MYFLSNLVLIYKIHSLSFPTSLHRTNATHILLLPEIMKLLAIVILAVVLAACQAQSNNAQWGQTGRDSALVFNYHVEKGSKLLQQVEERITYPPKVKTTNKNATGVML